MKSTLRIAFFAIATIISFNITFAANDITLNAESIHRSGTPDANTCSEKELLHCEVIFNLVDNAAQYQIVRNDEIIETLSASAAQALVNNGKVIFVDYAEVDPISEDEYFEALYKVNAFNAAGNQIATSNESMAAFYGEAEELAIAAHTSVVAEYNENQIFAHFSVEIVSNVSCNDINDIQRVEVYANTGRGFQCVVANNTTNDDNILCFDITLDRIAEGELTVEEIEQLIAIYPKAIYNTNEEGRNYAEKNGEITTITAAVCTAANLSGIENIMAATSNTNVKVYPNPAIDYITVEGNYNIVNIFNATGAKVAAAQSINGSVTFDVTSFANGVYFVKADNESATKIVKK